MAREVSTATPQGAVAAAPAASSLLSLGEPRSTATGPLPYEQIGPYQVLRVIGVGGMGTVYEALKPGIERRVAIKILHPDLAARPDARARLFREASAVNRVGHPGLAEVSEVEHLQDGSLYLVMEFLRGETLSARLQRSGGRLPIRDAVQLIASLADILSSAHLHGVVHRDIKPSNVMLVRDPQMPGGERVKLIDFGIAKLAPSPLASHDQTPQDTVLGTPDYMSPEQCSGSAHIDGKSDVYGLGALLFHILIGRPPFVAATSRLVMAKHQLETAPSISAEYPQAPMALATLLERMLLKDPAQRPAITELLQTLQLILSTLVSTGSTSESPVGLGLQSQQRQIHTTLAETALAQKANRRNGPVWRLLAGILVLVATAGGLGRWGNLARSTSGLAAPALEKMQPVTDTGRAAAVVSSNSSLPGTAPLPSVLSAQVPGSAPAADTGPGPTPQEKPAVPVLSTAPAVRPDSPSSKRVRTSGPTRGTSAPSAPPVSATPTSRHFDQVKPPDSYKRSPPRPATPEELHDPYKNPPILPNGMYINN